LPAVFGDGSALGSRIRYVVEPEPLGTAGGIKFASRGLDGPIVVFNGDVLTVDRSRRRASGCTASGRRGATIVLTPVENPSAFGLVETDSRQNILRFLEKPKPEEITTNRINAGIYVLEPDTFGRIPDGVPWSIERKYFPSLIERGETFWPSTTRATGSTSGRRRSTCKVHHDILTGRFPAAPFREQPAPRACVSKTALIHPAAIIESPCFVDDDAVIEAGARIAPLSVVGRGARIETGAVVEGAIIWPVCVVGAGATISGSIAGRDCRLGANTVVEGGAVLGDGTSLTDFTRV
jgi:NDP-sugar pyrophosphorylase family protein